MGIVYSRERYVSKEESARRKWARSQVLTTFDPANYRHLRHPETGEALPADFLEKMGRLRDDIASCFTGDDYLEVVERTNRRA